MNNNILAIGDLAKIENLCPTCVWRGCGKCPNGSLSFVNVEQRIEDFPQIEKWQVTPTQILVCKCRMYVKKPKLEKSVPTVESKSEFTWDIKSRSFVKRLKK